MRLLMLILVLFAVPAMALADDLTESDYVDYYFGTDVVLKTPTQVTDRSQTYWGDLLPQEYMYGQAALVDVINQAREDAGRDDLLDVALYPISIGNDRQAEGGGWEYFIEFRDCTPTEAKLVLDKFGLGDAFADAEITYEPVKIAYFSNYISDIGIISLELPGGVVQLDPDAPVSQYFDDIDKVLRAKYGDKFKTEIYYSVGSSVVAEDSTSISVTVYLDGAEQSMGFGYYDY